MLTGLMFVVVTGLLWAMLGIVMARVAERTPSPSGFYTVAYGLAAIAGWACAVEWSALSSISRIGPVVFWTGGAGVMSAGYQLSLAAAFRRGPRGVSWAVVQSALIVPFLLGVLVGGDKIGPAGWGGVALVLAALPFLGDVRSGASRPGWGLWVAAAFTFVACQQTMAGVPSRWPGWEDTAHLRPTLACTATAAVQSISAWTTRSAVPRADLMLAAIFAVVLLASFTTLFAALDRFSRLSVGAAVFPIAVGISILAFVCWSARFRNEPMDGRRGLGVGLLTTGILAMAMR